MAKSKDGPFGKLSGKVGNLVFATWRGIPYVRSRPSKPVSNTPAQQTQRGKFGTVVSFVGRILPVIHAGFKRNADLPERNAAISYLMKNAVRGEKPDIWIDYSAVLVARGNLPAPQEATAERTSDNNLLIQWNHNAELSDKRGDDRVLALAYFSEMEQGIWAINGEAARADGEIKLELPNTAVEKEMHVYLGFADVEENDASDSVYVGTA